MNDQDIADLWTAVNALRSAVAELTAVTRGIKVLLGERCEIRGAELAETKRRLANVEYRIWWASGAAAAVAFFWPIVLKLWNNGK